MQTLTKEEKIKLINAGLISYVVVPRKKPPCPPRFIGTPKERANKAVEYCRLGVYSLTKCLVLCGYNHGATNALKELIEGGGPLTESAKAGKIEKGKTSGTYRIIRDYYEIDNINGVKSPEDNELRDILKTLSGFISAIGKEAGMAAGSLSHFVAGHRHLKKETRQRIWKSLETLSLYKK